jgi:hypothetical protein
VKPLTSLLEKGK